MDVQSMSNEDLEALANGKTPMSQMSNAELEKIASGESNDEILGIPKTTIEGALRALPAAGAVVGGTLGFGAGSVVPGAGNIAGSVAGAGAGAFGGEALANMIRSGLDMDTAPKTSAEVWTRPLKEGALGAAGEGTGQLIGKIPAAVRSLKNTGIKQGVQDLVSGTSTPVKTFESVGYNQIAKPNSGEIAAASERLGGKATPGMMTANPNLQNVESVLNQSPTVAGEMVRKSYDPIKKGLKEGAEELAGAPGLSKFEAGEQFKVGLGKKISDKMEPLSTQFEKIRESSRNIPLNKESLNRSADRLLKQDLAEFAELPQGQAIQKYSEMIRGAKNLDSLKQLRSSVGDDMAKAIDAGDGQAAMAFGKVKGAIQRLERREILKSAIENSPSKQAGEQTAKDLINEIKTVNKGWSAMMSELQSIAQAGGIRKIESPKHLARIIDNMPSEKISEKFFNTKNYRGLLEVKKHLPDEFEVLRQAKLAQLAEKSLSKGEPDPVKLIRNVKSLGKEARGILFGSDGERVLTDMETVLNSLPNKVGASDTPRGISWFERVLKPGDWSQEANSALNYMRLQGKTAAKGTSRDGLKTLPRAVGYGSVAAVSTPTDREPKGSEKWLKDGVDKIKNYDPGMDSETLNAALKTKKGKDLVLHASNLKPGSKALDRIIQKLNEGK